MCAPMSGLSIVASPNRPRNSKRSPERSLWIDRASSAAPFAPRTVKPIEPRISRASFAPRASSRFSTAGAPSGSSSRKSRAFASKYASIVPW